ncbi:MAG: hypothetical protein M5U09_29045 [Gammaproteobacteria bacterium]|nr:hypothetical protein [Gammaproteobacteria bacterium]
MVARAGAAEFAVPAEGSRTGVRRLVAERLDTRSERTRQRVTFHDTFDWRLHRAGYSLELTAGTALVARLVRIEDGRVAAEQELDGEPPRFVRDWPRGPVSAAAAPACGVRALLPLVTLPAVPSSWPSSAPKTRPSAGCPSSAGGSRRAAVPRRGSASASCHCAASTRRPGRCSARLPMPGCRWR